MFSEGNIIMRGEGVGVNDAMGLWHFRLSTKTAVGIATKRHKSVRAYLKKERG